jgi:hypothetical protein
MLEMSKTVLQKVSFDKSLFKKELIKAKKWLRKEETLLLYAWCLATFGIHYEEIIKEVFEKIS